jgi:LysR family transcriptional activator of nhaA
MDLPRAVRARFCGRPRKVADYAELIFESSRELINWATQGALPKKRTVRIGSLSGLSRNFQFEFVEPLIEQTDFKFEVTTGDQQNLLRLLNEHELDVVLTSRNANSDNKANFHSNVLKSSPLLFVLKKDKKDPSNQDLSKLLKMKGLYIPGRQFESKAELEAYLDSHENIRIAGEVDDTALLRVLAVRSGCVVAIPEMGILNEIKNHEVTVIHKLPKIEQKYYAITRQRRDPNPDVRFLIEKSKGWSKR